MTASNSRRCDCYARWLGRTCEHPKTISIWRREEKGPPNGWVKLKARTSSSKGSGGRKADLREAWGLGILNKRTPVRELGAAWTQLPEVGHCRGMS